MAADSFYSPWDAEGAITDIKPADIGWNLVPDSDYFEANTFMAHLDNGSYFFIQVVVSNLGMYTNSPAVAVKYLTPDHVPLEWAQSYYAKSMTLSNDNSTIHIDDKHFDYIDDGNGVRKFVCSLPYTGSNTIGHIELTFLAEGAGYAMGGDGRLAFDEARKEYSRIVVSMPRAFVTSKITDPNGMVIESTGLGFCSHVVQTIKAHKIASNYQLLKLFTPRIAIGLTALVSPNSKRSSQAYLNVDGELVAVFSGARLACHNIALDPKSGYQIPSSSSVKLEGKTLKGEPVTIDIAMEHSNQLECFDVLMSIPWVLRLIVKTFIASPWQYRIEAACHVTIDIGGEVTTLDAIGMREMVFMNEIPVEVLKNEAGDAL